MKKVISMLMVLTMAVAMLAGCGSSAKTPLAGTMEENASAILEKSPVQFMGGFMPVDLTDTSEDGLWAITSYTGLASGEKLTDIAVYESMMGVQAFSLVLVRVNDAANAKAVAEEMKDNIDTRKWICVGADELMVAGYSDTVMLIMLDTGLELKAQDYVDAFKAICGGELDFTI